MKSTKNLLDQLDNLPHFTKSTVNTYISRFLKRKDILPLKNGLYISANFFADNKSDISYSFYLANILRTPSYVSSWAALQYYNLATEAIYSITSVTSKVTRNYQTKAGNFTYQSIRRNLFSDFSLVKGNPASPAGRFDFYIASPSKALFDLLYFRTHQFRGVKLGTIKGLIEELRIDIDEIDKMEQKKFYSMIKNLYERTNIKKFKK